MDEPVTIDGSHGEGGGQVVRTSVSLAAITGRPVEIVNVRAGRSKPGFQAQHLTSVRSAAALCGAELRGAEIGSQYLRFTPGPLVSDKTFSFDIGTAGATGLVAQTLLIPMAFLPSERVAAEITGGTHVPNAPSADYVQTVYAPLLRELGMGVRVRFDRAGFFPKGGGHVTLEAAKGRPYTPLNLTQRGRLKRIRVFLTTSLLPKHVAERGQEALTKDLKGYGVPIDWQPRDLPSAGPGAAVVIVVECETGIGGFTSIGERGKPMERVCTEGLRAFQKWFASGAVVDEHLADQLVLPCALVSGTSRWTTPEVTEHLRTVLWVAQQFLPIEYKIEEQNDRTALVTVRGAQTR